MCFFFIFSLLLVATDAAGTDLGGLVKQTVAGNEAVLYNCSKEQDRILQQCYLEMFGIAENSTTLPAASQDPFKPIRNDVVGICTSYFALRNCHADVINDCLNYNTFQALFSSEVDAAYYVSETAFLQFYCDYGNDFVIYNECVQEIEINDFSDTIYSECSVLEVGSCESVARTTQCEIAVFRKSCGSRSIKSYCRYQKILTHMSGWNYCDYMPCINYSNSLRFWLLPLISFYILRKV
uniref:DUF19 domain-containing protein n=1 Tax=Caenorhabditis japonica TaxID=281687 RepID=A0A8R1IC98_CAEJA